LDEVSFHVRHWSAESSFCRAKQVLNFGPGRNTILLRGYAELELQKLQQIQEDEESEYTEEKPPTTLASVAEDDADNEVQFKIFEPNALRKRQTLARRTFGVGGHRPSTFMQKRLTMLAGSQQQTGMRRFTGLATSNSKTRQARAKVHEAAKAIQMWWRDKNPMATTMSSIPINGSTEVKEIAEPNSSHHTNAKPAKRYEPNSPL
jgi:hypothetical protein